MKPEQQRAAVIKAIAKEIQEAWCNKNPDQTFGAFLTDAAAAVIALPDVAIPDDDQEPPFATLIDPACSLPEVIRLTQKTMRDNNFVKCLKKER